jgi:hypothetical protein
MKKAAVLFAILCLVALPQPAPVLAGTGAAEPGRTVSQNADGLVVTWQTPMLQTVAMPDGSNALRMEGYGSAETPGAPDVPEDTVLVALPPGARPTLVVEVGTRTLLPKPEGVAAVSGTVAVAGEAGERVYELAQVSGPATEPVTLAELGVMRGVRLARLTFHPVLFAAGGMEVIREARATVQYRSGGAAGEILPAEAVAGDASLAALSSAVVNPAQMAISASQSPAGIALANRAGQAAIEVSARGLTAVTQAALASAGFPVGTVDPHTLHLERNGVEIPTEWDGDDDAAFEAGEALVFYAEPRFSRWTARDVYFLSASSAPRKTMQVRTVDPAGKPASALWLDTLFEENEIYTPDCYCAPIPAGRDGDRWVWDTLRKPDRTSANYPADLAAVDGTQPAAVTVWMIGFTAVNNTTHTVQVRVNGHLLGTVVFAGKTANPTDQATLTIPAGVLESGNNSVELTLAESGAAVDGVWLDAFSIHYARDLSTASAAFEATGVGTPGQYPLTVASTAGLRAYDVTEADNPERLAGIAMNGAQAVLADPSGGLPRRYAVTPDGTIRPADVVRMVVPLRGAQGADEIMITPPDFAADLAGLVSLRQSQGMTVVVEDVRAIYDAVDGRPQPEAIQAYLAAAYAQWTPRPAYALLVGDGTSDPRRYRVSSSATWIPPFLANVDPVIGEVPADNRYGMVDGNDTLADMWIGRLPVNSHVEAAITIGKIVDYERHPAMGGWNQGLLLVNDKIDPAVGNFSTENGALAAAYAGSRFGLTRLDYQASQAQQAFHQILLGDWNQGNGVVLYNGHASAQQWGADVLLHINDLPSLNNGSRLPVLVEMTCLTSSFQVPDVPTLDETLLRRSGKGVVAAWGPTGLGLSSGHMLLASGFLDQITADPGSTLGTAIGEAKLKLAATAPAQNYLLDTFTLLGDPAMKLNTRSTRFLPAVRTAKP